MNSIPKALREELAADPYYFHCARKDALDDHECERDPLRPEKAVDWEHALTAKGRQLQKRFAIVPSCWWAHRGPGMVKEINIWIALNRATSDEMLDLSALGGRDYFRYRTYLNRKYGVYKSGENHVHIPGINYGYPVGNSAIFS